MTDKHPDDNWLPEDHETPAERTMVPCNCCDGGEWWVECCNGAGGCSCNGQQINMGLCNVCHGTGYRDQNADERANIRAIEGACFIGSGPSSGWPGAKRLYRP